jgi:putative iron-regulated protein
LEDAEMKLTGRAVNACRAAAGAVMLLSTGVMAQAVEPAAVVKTYADIAQAAYEDSLATAKTLQTAIGAFLKEPTEDNLKAAREAWLAARVPYMQTEAFRFGNSIVDDWEGKVNAWPLDEGLIDYVSKDYGTESDENPLYVANVIAKKQL